MPATTPRDTIPHRRQGLTSYGQHNPPPSTLPCSTYSRWTPGGVHQDSTKLVILLLNFLESTWSPLDSIWTPTGLHIKLTQILYKCYNVTCTPSKSYPGGIQWISSTHFLGVVVDTIRKRNILVIIFGKCWLDETCHNYGGPRTLVKQGNFDFWLLASI